MATEALLVKLTRAEGGPARFPLARPRRLRLNPQLRTLVRETHLAPDDLIYPLFITHGHGVKNEIKSMPGMFQWSPDLLGPEVQSMAALGIPAVLLFGLPAHKDPSGRKTSRRMASSSKRRGRSKAPCRRCW